MNIAEVRYEVQNRLNTSRIATAVLAAAGAGGGILAAEQVHGPSKIMYALVGSLAVAGATIVERVFTHRQCKQAINTEIGPTPEVNNKIATDDPTTSIFGAFNGASVVAGLSFAIGHNFPEGVSTIAPNAFGLAGLLGAAVSIGFSWKSAGIANVAYQKIITDADHP